MKENIDTKFKKLQDQNKILLDQNQKLQLAVSQLMRRITLIERKANVMSHTLRLTESNVRQLGGKLEINEGKVQRVENILGRHY